MKSSLFVGILAVALAAPAAADRAEDDLQVVRKAVSSSRVAEARPPAEEPPAGASEARPTPGKGEPQWFRVRVLEKGGNKGKVSVNLPLALVRVLGDEWPIDGHGRCRGDRHCPTLGEVLRALDSGQSLVEIEDDEATVRVWVE
jgi:hypothetical protein